MPEDSKAGYIYVSPTCKACLLKREFIDSQKGEITLGDNEYKTLNYIIEKDGVPASRDEILKETREITVETDDDKLVFYNAVDKTVSDIRSKIDEVYIKTVRKVGYKWAPPKDVKSPIDLDKVGTAVAGPRRYRFMTPEEAAEKVEMCLAEFHQSEDEDESTKIVITIIRMMNRLMDEAYEDLRDYFESYADYLQEIGKTETVKEWLCSLMILKFLREDYMKSLSAYEERLQSSRNADLEDKLQKNILEIKDYLLEIDMNQEEYKRMIREGAPTQGRFL